jgi:hypothetical protein
MFFPYGERPRFKPIKNKSDGRKSKKRPKSEIRSIAMFLFNKTIASVQVTYFFVEVLLIRKYPVLN